MNYLHCYCTQSLWLKKQITSSLNFQRNTWTQRKSRIICYFCRNWSFLRFGLFCITVFTNTKWVVKYYWVCRCNSHFFLISDDTFWDALYNYLTLMINSDNCNLSFILLDESKADIPIVGVENKLTWEKLPLGCHCVNGFQHCSPAELVWTL